MIRSGRALLGSAVVGLAFVVAVPWARGATFTGNAGTLSAHANWSAPGTWLSGGAAVNVYPGQPQLIVNCINNGSGLIRVTLAVAPTPAWVTGDKALISGVSGTLEANGFFAVTVVDPTHLDLQGSSFTNAYVSGGVAVRNDIVVMKANYIDVDVSVGIGAGAANNSPYAIECDNPGLLTVNSGVTLTVRGMFATFAAIGFQMNPGSAMVFDTALASFPYQWRHYSVDGCTIAINGTLTQRCSISTTTSNSANFAYYNPNGLQADVRVNCCDFSNFGTFSSSVSTSTQTFSIVNCTFNHCSGITVPGNFSPAGTLLLQNDLFRNSTASSVVQLRLNAPVSGSGSRTVNQCSFDTLLEFPAGYYDCAIQNCFLNSEVLDDAQAAGHWKAFSGNFYRQPNLNNAMLVAGDIVNNYYFSDGATMTDPNVVQVHSNSRGTNNLIGNVFEANANNNNGAWLYSQTGCAPTSSVVVNIASNLCLPSANPATPGASSMLWTLVSGTTNLTVNIEHNTVCVTAGVSGFGMVLVGDMSSDTSPGQIPHLRSNLAWSSLTNQPSRFLRNKSASLINDCVVPSGCGYNAGWNLVASSVAAHTTKPGYISDSSYLFSTTPLADTTDVSLDASGGPNFVDATRCLATAYTVLFGQPTTGSVIGDRTATVGLLQNDPSKIATLMNWVKAGYVPQNALLKGAAHDGGDIGAQAYASNAVSPSVAGSPGPQRVLILYNASYTGDEDGNGIQDSLQVAQYYAQKRGVPSQNLLGLACSSDSGYSSDATGYSNFLNQVVIPVRNKLTQLGPDNIDILLFSYHTPYLAPGDAVNGAHSLDNAMMNVWNLSTVPGTTMAAQGSNPYLDPNPTFGQDHSYFNHALYRISGNNIYLTSRLDGPLGLFGVLAEVDAASYGSRYISVLPGYYNGNGYVDSRDYDDTGYTDASLATNVNVINGYYYAYDLADQNIAYAEHFIAAAGLPLKWENTDKVLGQSPGLRYQDGTIALTAPRTLLYAGWYDKYSYIYNVLDFLPGCVVNHLKSNTLQAGDLRSPVYAAAFGISMLVEGATCVSGVVNEPYLTGNPRPNVEIWAILQGYAFAEAAGLSTPDVGWMELHIGDPLYAPFAAKTPMVDTQIPVFAPGFPKAQWIGSQGNQVFVTMSDVLAPEVVRVRIDYGATTNYDQSLAPMVYMRQHAVTLPHLPAGTVIHYCVTATDPAGNAVVSGDQTYTYPAGSLVFSASPMALTAGQTTTLDWGAVTNATSLTLDQGTGPAAVSATGGVRSVTLTGRTLFTLTASGPGWTNKAPLLVLADNAPTVAFYATPTAVASGQVATLTWSALNATNVSIDNGVGTFPASGSVVITPTGTGTTYTLTASGLYGQSTATVTVAINPLPITTFTASPMTLSSAGYTYLTWATTNHQNSFTAILSQTPPGSSQTTGDTANNVSRYVTTTTTFLITVNAPGGVVSLPVTVTVTGTPAPPPAIYFRALPTNTLAGQAASLAWNTANATNVTIDNGVGPVALCGTVTVSPTNTTTYTLTATGTGTTSTATATITVAPAVPAITFSATPVTINRGQSTVLGWTTTSATNVTVNQGIGTVASSGSNRVSPAVSSAYTITAQGSSGVQTVTVWVNVVPPPPALTFAATPSTIAAGQSAALSWGVSDATAISIDQGIGAVDGGGALTVSPTNTTTYALTAVGPGGVSTGQVVVTISGVPAVPTATLAATPGTVVAGQASTLGWSTLNATNVSIDNGVGNVGASGTLSVTPVSNTVYTLTAVGSGGTVTATVGVAQYPAPGVTFAASPTSVVYGSSATLSWTSTNAVGMTLSGVGTVPLSGSTNVTPLNPMTTYTLTAVGPGGTTTGTVTVAVSKVPPRITTFRSSPSSVTNGQSATLSWATLYATNVTIDQGIGTVAPASSVVIWPTNYTVYTLVASGDGGAVTSIAAVAYYAPVVMTFTATPPAIARGQSVSLAWTVNFANSGVNIAPGIGSLPFQAGGNYVGTTNLTPLTNTTYTLTAYSGWDPTWDASNSVSITVTSSPNPVITWATPADFTYGTALGAGQLNATSVVPGSFTYQPPSGSVLNAGTNQTLTTFFAPTDPLTYNSVTQSVAINVLKAGLTVTANNKGRPTGQLNPAFDASYAGFVNGDTTGSLSGTLVFDCTATSNSPAGTYPITPGGLTASNYTIVFVAGSLTVSSNMAGAACIWTGASSPNWNDSANWSGGVVPVSTNDVIITNTAAWMPVCTVAAGTTTTVASLELGTGATNMTLTLNGLGSLATVGGFHVGAKGILTHGDNPTNAVVAQHKLNVVCASFTMDPGSMINLDGLGFKGTNGPAGASVGGASSIYGGGSYGGLGGGTGRKGGDSFDTYGSAFQPTDLGCGSAVTNCGGGGAVCVLASGAVTLNGTITVRGTTGTYGGGSGGSIWITANTLSGNGTNRADGANGAGSSGGGGGGRIALNYGAASSFTPVITAKPGTGGGFHAAEMGTLYVSNPSFFPANLVITQTLYALAATNYGFNNLTVSNATLEICAGSGTVAIVAITNNLVLTNGAALVLRGDRQTRYGSGCAIVAGNIFVATNSSINADGKGFRNGGGPGCLVTGNMNAGGSYGGDGGSLFAVVIPHGLCYGSFTQPTALGSSGGAYTGYSVNRPMNTVGGGAIQITVTNTFVLNGRCSADGTSGCWGGGSGGSLWIMATNLTGTGTFSAQGGNNAGGDSGYAGAGGGGRIAIYAGNRSGFTGAMLVDGAAGNGAPRGRPGTLYLPEFFAPPGIAWTVRTNMALPPGTNYFTTLIVTNGAYLDCQGDQTARGDSPSSLTNYGRGVTIVAQSIVVASNSGIYADGQGFCASNGPGHGIQGGYINIYNGGGNYGGLGGVSNLYAGQWLSTYGSSNQPTALGSGAGNPGFYGASHGGGAIRLNVARALTLNGTITANGVCVNGSQNYFSGGSGGSIWINAASLFGSGVIQASGGGGNPAASANGGGGGRVAIYYSYPTASFPTGAIGSLLISVTGGVSGASAGTAGTTFFSQVTPPGMILILK